MNSRIQRQKKTKLEKRKKQKQADKKISILNKEGHMIEKKCNVMPIFSICIKLNFFAFCVGASVSIYNVLLGLKDMFYIVKS